jgi:hypothetical protein
MFSAHELAILVSALDSRIKVLRDSGDFPEKGVYEALRAKLLTELWYMHEG